jgi:hypothetical protein
MFTGAFAYADDPSPLPSPEPSYPPHEQYAMIWGGGKKSADAVAALKQYKKDFALFKGAFQTLEAYPMTISGGRIKGLDTNDEVVLLGYCNDEQVKGAIAFYKSFHPAAYAKKIWSDWDDDRCPYPTGFDDPKVGARKKVGKMSLNVVAYGPMTVAFLWNARGEPVQSRKLEVAEANDLTQDIGCKLSLDPAHADVVQAACEARRTHTGGIGTLTGHFKVTAPGGKLRVDWIEEKKVMDSGE